MKTAPTDAFDNALQQSNWVTWCWFVCKWDGKPTTHQPTARADGYLDYKM